MKLYIKHTQGTKASGALKRLATALKEEVGYKVWRSTKDFPKKRALKYGQGVDKINQYKWFALHSIPALEFTTSHCAAVAWMEEDNVTVIGRRLTQASCGKGIVIYDHQGKLAMDASCPVYTKYKKKKREFRVHVFKDQVVRVVEKKLRKDWNGPRDSKIRNLANGFVFCACETFPDELHALALKAAGCVSSDFKGVDIGYNEKLNELFVIEVNSAPGCEGSTVDAYVSGILSCIQK